jgi:hypothetical protein
MTAKDSSSTLSGSSNAEVYPPKRPNPRRRLVPRAPLAADPPLHDLPSNYETPAYYTRKPSQLTTLVSASTFTFDEDELAFPANAITVEHNLVRQVSERASENSACMEQRCPSSDEELFRRC